MKPYIVAEMSANHLGSRDRAKAIVRAAADAGADAIKLQTFTPEQMANPDIIIRNGPWAGRSALELYQEAHTPREWHEELFWLAGHFGIEAFSSVFHPDDVDFLEGLDCPRYKISSFELNDHALIQHAVATGKPLIISIGMARFSEIYEAWAAARAAGCEDLTFLKCTSAYPAPAAEANLSAGRELHYSYDVKWGLSDHTLGVGVACAAAALGASMIEKHLTLSRSDGGPDAAFSMEPEELAQLVTECGRAAEAIGTVRYGPTESESAHVGLRRSSGGKRAA